MIKDNFSMLCDFYEFTMGNGYFENGIENKIAYFDMFFRTVPDGGGYAITAGLSQVIEYIENLKFTDDDIEFLKKNGNFSQAFLEYLRNFKFECDVWAIPEGTPVFPGEPLMIVKGPVIQAQLLETMILLSINHQSLVATKASRIVRAAKGRPVMEFGARRAQGTAGAVEGARAAYIAGCAGTSCTLCGEKYDIPVLGTMAHSWVQMFPDELSAFKAYARINPDNCVLLVDTYNVLKSGIPNAIKAFKEEVVPRGFRPKGIRIDSGDITYLTQKARILLDEAGFADCGISISNSLDEIIIRETLMQGAEIDSFGVGERLITSKSDPVFGGVYKITAVEEDGEIVPKIKISENTAKITTPHFKKIYRLFSKETNKAIADLICTHDEQLDDTKPVTIFDPVYTWKQKEVTDYYAVELLEKIYDNGKLIYNEPSCSQIRDYCKEQMAKLWNEVLRFENPHKYYVDLSQKLWDIKDKLIKDSSFK